MFGHMLHDIISCLMFGQYVGDCLRQHASRRVFCVLLAWEHQHPRQQVSLGAQITSSDFAGSLLCTLQLEEKHEFILCVTLVLNLISIAAR